MNYYEDWFRLLKAYFMVSLDKKHLVFLLLFALVWNHCFDYIGLKSYIIGFHFIAILFTLYIVITCFTEFFLQQHRIITALYLGLCMTFGVSVFYWGQPVVQTYVSFLPSFVILIFFYLHQQKVRIYTVEMFMGIAAVMYIICWLCQLVSLPDLIFGMDRDGILNKEVRGFYRFWIPNKEHLPFLIFFFLKMYNTKRKPIYLILSVTVFTIVILHVVRQMIFWSALLAILYYFSEYKRKHKFSIFFWAVILISVTVLVNKSTIVNELFKMTQQEKVIQNIRYKSAKYFLSEYSKDPITIVTGNGFATKDSKLREKIINERKKRYYRTDVGFIGMFCDTGLWSVVLYLILLYHVQKLNVFNEHVYLKYYILYMYGSFLLGHALTSNLLFIMLAVYILEISAVLKLITKIKMKEFSIFTTK